MNDRTCGDCGAHIPQGMSSCPRCLLQLGISPPSRNPDPSSPSTDSERAGAPPNRERTRAEIPSPEEISPLFSNLEVIEAIGRGGMGIVYRAHQPKLDRSVALKILPPELADTPGFAERFLREARMLARLSHPNIVGVYDFGETDGTCWLLMEYVDGVDLRTLMTSGEMTPQTALRLVPMICDALQYAHDASVVHRDIKPENILLDRQGKVKVVDFGLAKLLDKDSGEPGLTRTDQVMGTMQYMAPEQMTSTQSVDHRADIYSLGVVLYEMLTGKLPIGRFEPPSDRASVSREMDDIVLRTLEQEPARRYQQAVDVKSDVEALPPGDEPPAEPKAKQGTRTYGPGAVAFTGLVGSYLVWTALFGGWFSTFFGISGPLLAGLGPLCLAITGAWTLVLSLRTDRPLLELLLAGGKKRLAARALLAIGLFGGAWFMFAQAVDARWERGTEHYVSSRTDHRQFMRRFEQTTPAMIGQLDNQYWLHVYQSVVGEVPPIPAELVQGLLYSDLDLEPNTPFLLAHRPSWIGRLLIAWILLTLSVLPLILVRESGRWRRCRRHLLLVPGVLVLGLLIRTGTSWAFSLDAPPDEHEAVERTWVVEARGAEVIDRLHEWLASERFEVHSHIDGALSHQLDAEITKDGTVKTFSSELAGWEAREQEEEKSVDRYKALGARPVSIFDRWDYRHKRPVRLRPHLVIEVFHSPSKEAWSPMPERYPPSFSFCVVHVDAGTLERADAGTLEQWNALLAGLRRAIEGRDA